MTCNYLTLQIQQLREEIQQNEIGLRAQQEFEDLCIFDVIGNCYKTDCVRIHDSAARKWYAELGGKPGRYDS